MMEKIVIEIVQSVHTTTAQIGRQPCSDHCKDSRSSRQAKRQDSEFVQFSTIQKTEKLPKMRMHCNVEIGFSNVNTSQLITRPEGQTHCLDVGEVKMRGVEKKIEGLEIE